MFDLSLYVLGDVFDVMWYEFNFFGLIFYGCVFDFVFWLDSCFVLLVFLCFGVGVKGKINMVMSYGVLVIVIFIVVEGMQLNDCVDVLVVE